MTDPTPADTRGILAPQEMMRHVDFARYPAVEALEGLISWCWSVRWNLRFGFRHAQQVLSHPQINVSVGIGPPDGPEPPPGPYRLQCVVNGVNTALSTRVLTGEGWNLAAKTTTGGFGAWIDDVRTLNDRAVPLGRLLGLDDDALAEACADASFGEAAVILQNELAAQLERRDPVRIELAREVARVAEVAEVDRTVRRVEQLASLAGVTERTLQRMFASCAGVSPLWVVRRFRLIDAAEMVRDGAQVDWAEVAAALGYADQAHLTRDFTHTIGQSPAAYVRQLQVEKGNKN